MQGKKIIISAFIVIAGAFIGFISGLFIKFEAEYNFKIDFMVKNRISGVEIYMNELLISKVDSSGYFEFSHRVKRNSELTFTFKKANCMIYPRSKSFLVTNHSKENHIILDVFPAIPPKLVVQTKDWRGNTLNGAQISINNKPVKIRTSGNGRAVIPLNGFRVGEVLQLDANYQKMYALRGNDKLIVSEDSSKYKRNIVLYKRPENWIEFSVTSNNSPVKNIRFIRDGRSIALKYRNNKYFDWLHEINKTYAYTLNAGGYETKKIKVTPTKKGRNKISLSLEKLSFNLRLKDKSNLNSNMENIIIYKNNRKIGQTNSMGMAVNLPISSLNRANNRIESAKI